MLFTRCPDCQTTFRITNDVLHKADGQVRCGRCSNIFNAYADLRERPDAPRRAEPPPESRPAPEPRSTPASKATAEHANAAHPAAAPAPFKGPRETAAPLAPEPARNAPTREPHGAAPNAAPAAADDAIGAAEIDAVLEDTGRTPVVTSLWTLHEIDDTPPPRTVHWRIAAALATLLLAGQVVHHFRAELASVGVLGAIVQGGYSFLGMPIAPRWNLDQYEVVDWIAAAEPNARGRGRLVITARVHNRGPDAQPYPHVELKLLDRWEAAVGRRVFRPDEYLVARLPQNAMMQAGDTAEAEFVVVDPGPDAYGFELDVCVEAQAELQCSADNVFR